jgi:hypothetical protein
VRRFLSPQDASNSGTLPRIQGAQQISLADVSRLAGRKRNWCRTGVQGNGWQESARQPREAELAPALSFNRLDAQTKASLLLVSGWESRVWGRGIGFWFFPPRRQGRRGTLPAMSKRHNTTRNGMAPSLLVDAVSIIRGLGSVPGE